MTARRLTSFAAIALCVSVHAACGSRERSTSQQSATTTQAAVALPQGGTQTAQAGDLICVTYCSATAPRTPVAEIRWVVANQPASAENLRKAAGQQSVDAAVNEDGFDRGRFVRLSTVAPQARFGPAGAAPATPLPGLGNLSVSAVGSSQEPSGALRLATPPEGGQENVVLQVQGLRPGLNYYWRVRAAAGGDTRVVMCRAPICPSDRKRP